MHLKTWTEATRLFVEEADQIDEKLLSDLSWTIFYGMLYIYTYIYYIHVYIYGIYYKIILTFSETRGKHHTVYTNLANVMFINRV